MQTPPTIPSTRASSTQDSFEQLTTRWFEQVVLGLNLCPFAHKPARDNIIRFTVCDTNDEVLLLDTVLDEIQLLANISATECETTVIIVPYLLGDFYDYQFFLSEAERKLKQKNWKGTFQLASFHPNYCFAGTEANDASNLTNRSPYPIIHILRQESLNAVLKEGDTSEEIVERNIDTMRKLSNKERNTLFSLPFNNQPINNKS
jgi:hypothetical protein